jgi:DNA-binding MurR/RpiR family transcriptional regulator
MALISKASSPGPPGAGLAVIRSLYPSLTKAERKVADVVLEGNQQTVYGSITDLAERAGVGETSVLRFCRHVGYRGFQDFKLALARELTASAAEAPGQGSREQASLYERVTRRNTKLLEETASLLSEESLDQATRLLIDAKGLIFFGVGSSGMTAESARHRFLRVGMPVEAVSEGHLAAVKASLLGTGDVAVVITVSGSTIDAVDVARIAKEGGATVVCITSHARSPVTRFADLVLLGASREGPDEGSSLHSKIVQLHVLDLLFESVLESLGDRGRELLRKTAESVSTKLY